MRPSFILCLAGIFALFGYWAWSQTHVEIRRAKESTLKHDLQGLRTAIDQYAEDKRQPPISLQDLVDAHYIREIPIDPVTHQRDWVVHRASTAVRSEQNTSGIDDVFSNSTKCALDGTTYNTW